MRLTVLGCSGTYPTEESACSGYLFSADGFNLLVDAGPGTFINVQQHIDVMDLDAVVLTHWHPDHCTDIYPLFYSLRFNPEHHDRLKVFAPVGTEKHLFAFLSGDSRDEFQRVFDFKEIDAATHLELGPFSLKFALMVHPIETLGVSINQGGRRVVYSSDTGPGGGLTGLAREADVLICEATYESAGQGPPIHLAAREAGELATASGVGRLLLTHRFPTIEFEPWYEEAVRAFSGSLEAVREGTIEEI